MLSFRVFRINSADSAVDFELGDLEFKFHNETISSRGNSRFSNMIYISISGLIEGLLKIHGGSKKFEFVGVDSSFIIKFEKTKNGIYVRHQKKSYGPFVLREILNAIDRGVENLVSEPKNRLPQGTAASNDFNASWNELKTALSTNK